MGRAGLTQKGEKVQLNLHEPCTITSRALFLGPVWHLRHRRLYPVDPGEDVQDAHRPCTADTPQAVIKSDNPRWVFDR